MIRTLRRAHDIMMDAILPPNPSGRLAISPSPSDATRRSSGARRDSYGRTQQRPSAPSRRCSNTGGILRCAKVCDRTFNNTGHLHRHMNTQHPPPRNHSMSNTCDANGRYPCNECHTPFCQPYRRNDHISKSHRG